MLDAAEREGLIDLAHDSIVRGLGRARPDPLPVGPWSAALLEPRATFTTLTIEGELRGCRGTLEPSRSLVADIWHNAWASAYDDPRFAPVEAPQIAELEIAISVLSALEPIPAESEFELLAALEPGVDGLVLCHGVMRTTFLPAVWENLPEPRDFVAQLKRKAGWPASFWSADLRAYRYRTESIRRDAACASPAPTVRSRTA